MNKDFITIRQATELTGKADITIRRLIRRLIKQNNPETIQMIRQKQAGKNFIYKINKDLLFKELKMSEPVQEIKEKKEFFDTREKKQTETPETVEVLKAKNEIINILKGELYKKDGQMKTKDWQIGSLGKKIDNLIERDRETNILLKGLQDRVFMLEGPKKPQEAETEAVMKKESQKAEEKPADASTDAEQAIKEEAKEKPKKKKKEGFFSGLFKKHSN